MMAAREVGVVCAGSSNIRVSLSSGLKRFKRERREREEVGGKREKGATKSGLLFASRRRLSEGAKEEDAAVPLGERSERSVQQYARLFFPSFFPFPPFSSLRRKPARYLSSRVLYLCLEENAAPVARR